MLIDNNAQWQTSLTPKDCFAWDCLYAREVTICQQKKTDGRQVHGL